MTYEMRKWLRPGKVLRRVLHPLLLSLFLVVITSAIGPEFYSPAEWTERELSRTVAGMGFDLMEWETYSLRAKARAFWEQPAAGYTEETGAQLVRDYLARAQRISQVEQELEDLLAQAQPDAAPENMPDDAEVAALQQKVESLRTQQNAERAAVEQLIQQQVGSELVAAGFALTGRPFPPVLFGFIEPPKKMVVSPRDRIETVYAHMLDAEVSLATVEEVEQEIYRDENLSAYITNIGGLGAFPTMVVDRASLEWILSTVAHEWTHNYLSLFPLGLNYAKSSELTTLNETVAEIVGNEIGARTLRRYYPELAPPEPVPPLQEAPTESVSKEDAVIGDQVLTEEALTEPDEAADRAGEAPFDFGVEMRKTRLRVDELLAAGEVEEAEAYMEERRQRFAENGYPLRVLNQAYFAFHGSYGTSPASSSPIGPAMDRLRAAMPDLETFLHTVRWFTSEEELQQALAEWAQSD